MEQRNELLRRLEELRSIRDADRDPAYPVGSPRNPAVDLPAIEAEIDGLVETIREMPRRIAPHPTNANLTNANADLWTLAIFEVQLGIEITAEEAEYLPGATQIRGVWVYPEHKSVDGESIKYTRNITFCYDPVQAALLGPANPDWPKTLRAAFREAIKQARERDKVTGIYFYDMGTKLKRRRLIENTLYAKKSKAS